ncbi:MAG TPA: aminoglycoside phosphotransferase family protein, partial [Pseudomonadales bacterium]
LADDLPELAVGDVVPLGEGWDFTTFLVDDEWVFRFPKRRQCARQLAREHRLLETLAGPLASESIAIPRHRYYVREPVDFALAYVGYPFLRSDALIDCPQDGIDRIEIGRQLGDFLRRLHAAAPTPAPRIYHDTFPSDLVDFRRELAQAKAVLPESIATACTRLLADTPRPDLAPPRFVHGDLGAEHILVDRGRNRITAIIDWGDAGWGNPIGDLVGLWAWGGDAAVTAAVPNARALSPSDWSRMRVWGVAYAIGSAYYGHEDGRDRLYATALGWLERMQRAGQLANPETPDV